MDENKEVQEKKMTFESALERLEAIVSKLERGDAALDESLKLYEEAAGLIRRCNNALEQAERKVTILMKNSEGVVTEQTFDPGNIND